MSLEEQLLEMKDKVDRAKTEKARIDGETAQLIKQLKEEGAETLEAAKELIAANTTEVASLEKEFEDMVVALQQNYNWGA